jgi:SecD/SecF fusion protein
MLYFSRWKTTLIWLAVLAGIVFAAPNLLDRQQAESLPDWVPSKQLTLGLDLQGGSYMLLQVEREDIIKDRLTTTVDDVRRLLREAGIGYTGLSGTGQMVQVRIRDDARVEEAKEILAELSEPVAAGLLGGGTVVEASIEETQPASCGSCCLTKALRIACRRLWRNRSRSCASALMNSEPPNR